MRRVQLVVSAAVCLGLLSGCAAQTSDTPGSTASPTTTASSSPSPTAEAAGPRDLSDPELGVEFSSYPQTEDAETSAAVETYMLFELEFWRALTTNVVPPAPWAIASDASIAWIQAQVGPNTENGWKAAGSERVSIEIVSATDDTLVLAVCTNWHDASFENVDGTVTTIANGLDETTATNITLSDTYVTGWKVVDHEVTGAC